MDALEKALYCSKVASDKKAHELVIINVREFSSFADFFIVCSGTSTRQVQAVAEHVEAEMKKQGFRPIGIEGMRGGRWVLLDYGDVIVHVFHQTERDFYGLEDLWAECPRIAYDAGERT